MKKCLIGWLLLCSGIAFGADQAARDLCEKNFSSYKDRLAKNPADDAAKATWMASSQRFNSVVQMQQKNYERAVEHFDQSISLKSEQPLAYFQMGMAYLFLNETTKASQAAERAVELEPTNPAHHRQLAYTQLLLGEFGAAEISAKKAIQLDKEDLAAHKILAKIYAKEDNNAGMTQELALVKEAEQKFAAAHPELAKKPEPSPKPEEEEEDKKSKKPEDYEIIGSIIDQWNRMKAAIGDGNIDLALTYYSDYLDTRDQYRDSFKKLGLPRLESIFSSFGDLYDCEIVFASAHCKSLVKNDAGTVIVTPIRFERNPDHTWRIRSF